MKYVINNKNILMFEYTVPIYDESNKQIRVYKGKGRSKAIKAYKREKRNGNYSAHIDIYYYNTKLERYSYFDNFFE